MHLPSKRLLSLYAGILLAVWMAFYPVAANALDEGMQDTYSQNDILFFNPDMDYDTEACNPGDSIKISGSNNIEITLTTLMGKGMSLAQAAGVAGNFILETGDPNINPAAQERKGQMELGGFGIAQWTGARWRGTHGLRNFAEHKNTSWDNMSTQVQFLLWEVGMGESWNGKKSNGEEAGWKATLNETTPAGAAETWMRKFERPGVPHLDRRIAAAESVYAKYKDSDLAANVDDAVDVADSNCSSDSAVNGDVAATAKALAWPHQVKLPFSSSYGYGKDKAKKEFVTEANKLTNDYHTAYYTDCGVFVATVMRSSGVDPTYPARGTSVQMNYLKSSSKYETFYPKSEAEMQPGDILIRDGHTYMYVGSYTATSPSGKTETWSAVGASLYTRPPSGHFFYLSGSSSADISSSNQFMAARFIGNGGSE